MAEPIVLPAAPLDLPIPFPDLSSVDLPPSDFDAGDFVFNPDLDLLDLDFDFNFDLDVDLPLDPSLPPPLPLGDPSSGLSSSSSGSRAPPSPESGCSGASAVTGGEATRKSEEEPPDTDPNPNPESTKARRLDESEKEAKRRSRLVRNRESAHLSRQRKKLYVEELEEKVKAMHATIADLTAKISYLTAENAGLRQQLGGGANLPPPPPYPALYPLPPPWIPAYAMRSSHVPLVPIPRLKREQPAATPPAKKAKKVETKNCEGKTKKLASVSLLGLLCLLIVSGALVGVVNHMHRGIYTGRGAMSAPSHNARVLAGDEGHLNDHLGSIDPQLTQNASETLPALLYLPRNGQHFKINGNLVIKSVLASEKAIIHKSSNGKSSGSRGKEENSLAIPRFLSPSEAGKVPESKKGKADHLMALPPGNGNGYSEDDGLLPQWFSEAMAGPMLTSGMCTEVFQFEVSPTSAHANGIVPVYSTVSPNSSRNSTDSVPSPQVGKMKNRRILYSRPIPLGEVTSNNRLHLKTPPKNDSYGGKKPISSVVVSILADPREAGDGNDEGRISSNSLSRIFVVVLIDSVKTFMQLLDPDTEETNLALVQEFLA